MGFVIEDGHYEEARKRLVEDPIIRDMAEGLRSVWPTNILTHHNSFTHDGTSDPRFEFMQAANSEYRKRGGTDGGHIGAVAEAIIRILGS